MDALGGIGGSGDGGYRALEGVGGAGMEDDDDDDPPGGQDGPPGGGRGRAGTGYPGYGFDEGSGRRRDGEAAGAVGVGIEEVPSVEVELDANVVFEVDAKEDQAGTDLGGRGGALVLVLAALVIHKIKASKTQKRKQRLTFGERSSH